MNFIKSIFEGNTGKEDSEIHEQFQKFGKGEFKDKALISAKKRGNNYNISTSPEFVNEMIYTLSNKLGEQKTNVTGAIVSTRDLEDYLEFKDKKQFQGVKRYIIDKEMSGNQILEIMKEFPKAFYALSFSFNEGDNNYKISTKPKAPKSGKPSPKGDQAPKADFSKLTTNDKSLAEEFIFEKEEEGFENADITHTFVINSLEIPEEAKKSGDYKRMKEEALRKGKVIRKGEIDGEQVKKEAELLG